MYLCKQDEVVLRLVDNTIPNSRFYDYLYVYWDKDKKSMREINSSEDIE